MHLADTPQETNQVQTNQVNPPWGLDRIDQRALPLDSTYNYGLTGSGVQVYIIDTGIRITHQQFGGRASNGYDAVDGSLPATDCNGHGTHVAGTVGGSTYGVAKNAQLIAVRVLDCTGSGTFTDVIEGIDWVTHQKIMNSNIPMVANMSLGGEGYGPVDDAIRRSIGAGVTYVISGGNNNGDFPHASYSNYGACLDVFAPGSEILSAWIDSDTSIATLSGTSMASPHVADVIALYLEQNPRALPAVVTTALLQASTANTVSNPGLGSQNRFLYSQIQFKGPQRQWLINYAANGFGGWDVSYAQYGGADAHPVPADYDGDGKADLSVKVDN